MGCDIHTYVEVKRHINDEEKWVTADYYKKNPYYLLYSDEDKEFEVAHIYDYRNYELFSILADVRNYSNNKPIFEPRGIPKDCCQEIRDEYKMWGSDGHSHSWLTLEELMDYAGSHKIIKHSGLISERQSIDLDNGIKPDSWCRWTNVEGYVYREWEEEFTGLDIIIDRLKKRLEETLCIYGRINEYSDKIRLVFWFDN